MRHRTVRWGVIDFLIYDTGFTGPAARLSSFCRAAAVLDAPASLDVTKVRRWTVVQCSGVIHPSV